MCQIECCVNCVNSVPFTRLPSGIDESSVSIDLFGGGDDESIQNGAVRCNMHGNKWEMAFRLLHVSCSKPRALTHSGTMIYSFCLFSPFRISRFNPNARLRTTPFTRRFDAEIQIEKARASSKFVVFPLSHSRNLSLVSIPRKASLMHILTSQKCILMWQRWILDTEHAHIHFPHRIRHRNRSAFVSNGSSIMQSTVVKEKLTQKKSTPGCNWETGPVVFCAFVSVYVMRI